MINDDKSYERYKQYRRNKYRYEQEQIIFPIAVIAILTAIISLRKYILIAIAVACVIALIALVVYWYLKKQVTATQSIVISREDAKEGLAADITVKYNSSQAKVEIDIPPNVKDGQIIVIKDVIFEDENGRKTKKRLHLMVKVS